MGLASAHRPGDVCGAHAEGDEIMRVAPPRAARIGGAVGLARSLNFGEDVAVEKIVTSISPASPYRSGLKMPHNPFHRWEAARRSC
jgi:hypothetical protein